MERDQSDFKESAQSSRTVTKIEFQKRKTDRRSVFLDNEYAFSVSEQTFQQFPLIVSQILSEKQIAIIINHEAFEIAKSLALRYLTARMRSAYELRKYLRKKDCGDREILRAIEYCKDRQYIDDEQYAGMLVNDMTHLNRYGINKMRFVLKKRGISSGIIEKVLNDQIDPDVQFENAIALVKRKKATLGDDPKIKEKLYRFLKQRGFNYRIIYRVIDKLG